jgi:hypothetical protein
LLVIHRISGEILVQQKICFSSHGSVGQIQSTSLLFEYDMKEYLYSTPKPRAYEPFGRD